MQDTLIGIILIALGILFCFRGYAALRIIIPLWGAFAGFILGAGLVSGADGGGFLRTGLAWFVGILVGLVFGLLAYLYYEVSIVLAMGANGFTLGTSLVVALGAEWSWVIVLGGVVFAVLLALLAIVGNLPGVILLVLGALGGSAAIVAGAMLLADVIDTENMNSATVTQEMDASWLWTALFVGLAILGIVSQLRDVENFRESLRDTWTDAGGREVRSR